MIGLPRVMSIGLLAVVHAAQHQQMGERADKNDREKKRLAHLELEEKDGGQQKDRHGAAGDHQDKVFAMHDFLQVSVVKGQGAGKRRFGNSLVRSQPDNQIARAKIKMVLSHAGKGMNGAAPVLAHFDGHER
jgi:hypothetical protein